METINEAVAQSTPVIEQSTRLIADEIKDQVATLEAQVNTLRDSLYRERAHVRDLFTAINDDIESNDWNEEDTITLKEVSDYLEAAFSSKLVFTKEYEAYVEFTVKTTVKYRSENAESAQEIADSIGLDMDDSDVSYDGDAEVSEFWVDSTRVLSVEEQ
jgi:predicted metal-dependent RNase